MARPLEGKVGIVTGGSRGNPKPEHPTSTPTHANNAGIGEAIARNLASKGCSLLLNFTSESSRQRTESLCASLSATHSIRCYSIQADLSNPQPAAETILAAAQQHFNTPADQDKPNNNKQLRIDILINNAGVSQDRFLNDPVKGPIDPADFHWHYTINVLAPLLLTQLLAPYFPPASQTGGKRTARVVNISSVSASMGFTGQSVYGGTKAALEAMTRSWARELAGSATVNAINPGPVVGDMYFATGEGFWRQMQGFQDATPLSAVVEEGDRQVEEGLSAEEKALIRTKMGGRRPAFTSEVAGVVGMLCTEDGGWTTGSVVCANGGMKMGV